MPLVRMRELLDHAYTEGYAVGAFDVVSVDFIEAVMHAAETERAPVILSLAESHFGHCDFALLATAARAACERATIPAALHLDHGASLASLERAVQAGCNGLMLDASHLPYAENVAATRSAAALAHACGLCCEGELGYVPGVEGEDAVLHPGEVSYTSPEEAKAFVAATNIDCLAVSIGTVHGRFRGTPKLDLERLEAINSAVGLPLVIHGGSGLSDTQFRELIARGVAKVNYFTALADAAAHAIRTAGKAGSYFAMMAGVRSAIAFEARRCMQVFGAAGQAGSALAGCRLQRGVIHAVLFNSAASEDSAAALLERGRRELSLIPGVRAVEVGRCVQPDKRYRHAFFIRLSGQEAVPAYLRHPAHLSFADCHFRPQAPDRLTEDFELHG